MTPEQVALVQTSFAKVMPIKDSASELFYDRLFEKNPSVRSMFPDDVTNQRKKLMAALATVVSGLSKPDTINPAIQALGVKHVAYGAEAAHYGPVGEALIWTLEQGLGDSFDRKTRDAWIAAYTLLSNEMIEAAEASKAA